MIVGYVLAAVPLLAIELPPKNPVPGSERVRQYERRDNRMMRLRAAWVAGMAIIVGAWSLFG